MIFSFKLDLDDDDMAPPESLLTHSNLEYQPWKDHQQWEFLLECDFWEYISWSNLKKIPWSPGAAVGCEILWGDLPRIGFDAMETRIP